MEAGIMSKPESQQAAHLLWNLGKMTLAAIIGVLILAAVAYPFGCRIYLFHAMTCS